MSIPEQVSLQGQKSGVRSLALDRLLHQHKTIGNGGTREFEIQLARAQIPLERLHVAERLARQAPLLGTVQSHSERIADLSGNLLLDFEDISCRSGEPLGPELRVALGFDQLARHAQVLAGPPDGSFEKHTGPRARVQSCACPSRCP